MAGKMATAYGPLGLATLIIVLAGPLVLGKVPPNRLYGLRTPKTLSNPQIWYAANYRAGVNLIAAAVLAIVACAALGWWNRALAQTVNMGVVVGLALLATIASLRQVRRL